MVRLPQNPDKRYLGASLDLEAHDLDNIQPQCKLEEVLASGYARWFDPDTLEEIERRGFTLCQWCVGEANETE